MEIADAVQMLADKRAKGRAPKKIAARGRTTSSPARSDAEERVHGLFVTLEGGDADGKTTQAERLEAWLTNADAPGGARGARWQRPRARDPRPRAPPRRAVAPRAEALLYAADRAHHVGEVVEPALARGDVVLQGR